MRNRALLHSLMRWGLRLALAVGVSVVLLVVTLLALLGTHSGNVWLLDAAQRAEPRFSATLDSGILLKEATLSDLRWSDPGVEVLIPRLEWRWDWQCLSGKTLCLDQLRTEGARITLAQPPVDAAAPEEKAASGNFHLPVAIVIRNLQVQQSRLEAAGHSVELDNLQVSAKLDRSGLELSSLRLSELQVSIASPAAPPSKEVAGPESPALPEIRLPLPIRLKELDLKTARIRLAGGDYRIDRLQLSAHAEGTKVEIETFKLETPQASLQAKGRISLIGDYPLALKVQGQLPERPALNGLDAQLSATGSIADLAVTLTTSGPVTGRLKAMVKPLAPSLPFNADLSWQNLKWPFDEPTLFSDQGHAEIHGSLKGYSFQLGGDARGNQLPDLVMTAEGHGSSQQIRLDSLVVNTLDGQAELGGSLSWGNEFAWQGQISLLQIDPAELLPQFPGGVSGQMESKFLQRNGNWTLSLEQIELEGKLAEQPVRLRGAVQGDQDGDWTLSQLELHSGTNRLQVDGQIGEENTLQGQLEIVDLQTSLPGASGRASGTFNLSGKRDALRLEFSLSAAMLSYEDYKVNALDSAGQLLLSAMPQGSLRVKADKVTYQDFSFEKLSAVFNGDHNAHTLSLDLTGDEYSIHNSLQGQFADQLWSGQLQDSRIKTPIGTWSLGTPLNLSYDLARQQATIAGHCWHSGSASLCLNEEALVGTSGQLSVSLQDLSSSQLADLMPEGFSWQGGLNGNAAAQWAAGSKPRVTVDLSAGSGRLEVEQAGQKLQANYQQLELSASLDKTAVQGSLRLHSDLLGRGEVRLRVEPYQQEHPLQSEFQLTGLQLSMLSPLVAPLEELSGTLNAAGKLSGTLKKPLVMASASVNDGRFVVANLPSAFEKINLQLNLQGDQAQLGGDLIYGDGRADLAGAADWQQTPITGWLTLKGNRHKFHLDPQLDLLISPDLRLELQPELLALTGKIFIPYGRTRIKTLPSEAVTLSEDVVILDASTAPRGKQRIPFSMTVEVVLHDDVKIDAFGLEAGLEGSLVLRKSSKQPLSGNGNIELREGTYRAFGQNLLIKRGSLLFSGPLSKPFLDVDAIRNPEVTSDNVTAGIRLQGKAQNPSVTIYSEPAMAEQEAISYLLRGRSLGASSGSSQDSMVASMLIGAGLGRSKGTITELGKTFGVKELAVDTRGEGEETQLNVSGYLLPGVQIGYGVGIFSPITEVTLRYEILPKLVLEAASGLQSALDLLYEFEF